MNIAPVNDDIICSEIIDDVIINDDINDNIIINDTINNDVIIYDITNDVVNNDVINDYTFINNNLDNIIEVINEYNFIDDINNNKTNNIIINNHKCNQITLKGVQCKNNKTKFTNKCNKHNAILLNPSTKYRHTSTKYKHTSTKHKNILNSDNILTKHKNTSNSDVVLTKHKNTSNSDIISKKNEFILLHINDEIECDCCYTKYDFIDMIMCDKSSKHIFCKECINGYVKSGISEKKSTLNCMMYNDCSGTYTMNDVLKCVTDVQIIDQFTDIIHMNQLIGMSKILNDFQICPFCQKYGCVAENIQYIFCKRCNKEWCTLCKMAKHADVKCGKINDATNIDAIRRIVSETLTNALAHECPNCFTKYIKEDGCNKMTCPTCGSHSCYICNMLIKPIDGKYYYHFVGSGSYDKTTKSTCPLYNGTIISNENNKYNHEKSIKLCNDLLSVNTEEIQQIMLYEMKKLNVPIDQLNYKLIILNKKSNKKPCCIL